MKNIFAAILSLGIVIVTSTTAQAAPRRRAPVVPNLAVGVSTGISEVSQYYVQTGKRTKKFRVERANFRGGVSVAVGDVDGDGIADTVTGAGPGTAPYVRVFNYKGKRTRTFFAYDPAFRGGVSVAVGDVNGDGVADIVTGAGPGGLPHVRVFDGPTLAEIHNFYGLDTSVTTGINVACGDTNDDGFADIVVAPKAGAQPLVKVFSGTNLFELSSFYPYDGSFMGGVNVALGDFDGDGGLEVITGAGTGGVPEVVVTDSYDNSEVARFLAFDVSYTGGVSVTSLDVTGDGVVEIIAGTAGASSAPGFSMFDGATFGFLRFTALQRNRNKYGGGISLGGLQR